MRNWSSELPEPANVRAVGMRVSVTLPALGRWPELPAGALAYLSTTRQPKAGQPVLVGGNLVRFRIGINRSVIEGVVTGYAQDW